MIHQHSMYGNNDFTSYIKVVIFEDLRNVSLCFLIICFGEEAVRYIETILVDSCVLVYQ